MYDQSSKPSQLQSNFCPPGLSAHAPGLYTCVKSHDLPTTPNSKQIIFKDGHSAANILKERRKYKYKSNKLVNNQNHVKINMMGNDP